jgi:NAD(P)-dependent dehydrogenase (short-subunit alcohol dehydrogenase family)
MDSRLVGKVIVVTGASGFVGQGVVGALVQAGAAIALVDRNAERLAQIINDIGDDTERYKAFPADLNDPAEVDKLLNHIIDHFATIDGLVHTVGGYMAGDSVHDAGLDVWDKMMNLNARIVYLVCGRVAKFMVDNGTPGSISIVLARAGAKGSKGHAAYTASKAAATRIMESMAAELRDHGIRVNGVSPSIVDTPPNRQAMPDADFDKWVKPEQIGDLMAFLASDAASAITGTNIEISARS